MTVKVPTNGHPLVRELYQTINTNRLMVRDVCKTAGVLPQTVRNWKRRSPKLDAFEAVLNTMGLELVILPMAKPFSED
jgi:hypothetical protein